MIPIILKPILHFLTSGLLGVFSYIIFIRIFTKVKNKEKIALTLALFMSLFLHIIVDFGPGWF